MVRPGGNVGAGEKWLDYGCISNEPIGFARGLDRGCGENTGVRMTWSEPRGESSCR